MLGRDCKVGASAVIDGNTTVGDGTEIFPFASIGLPPQDLKYRGEDTRLVIGRRNIFREFVTIHRGTAGGGGETTIGDDNLFMAYAHVAHDCRIGNHTIFGNAATLGGHVTVEDFATISAYSGVHQFCRVGRYAFIGGYSVVTKDALPFAKTVGNRARVYGLNTIGLIRRGFTEERVGQLKRAYRYLLQSKLNTTQALLHIEQDPTLACEEVAYLVEFIRTATRGVILRPRRPPVRRRAGRLMRMKLGLDCRQRPVPVPGARRRPLDGPRSHRRRHQGRGLEGARGRGRRLAGGDRPLGVAGPPGRLAQDPERTPVSPAR